MINEMNIITSCHKIFKKLTSFYLISAFLLILIIDINLIRLPNNLGYIFLLICFLTPIEIIVPAIMGDFFLKLYKRIDANYSVVSIFFLSYFLGNIIIFLLLLILMNIPKVHNYVKLNYILFAIIILSIYRLAKRDINLSTGSLQLKMSIKYIIAAFILALNYLINIIWIITRQPFPIPREPSMVYYAIQLMNGNNFMSEAGHPATLIIFVSLIAQSLALHPIYAYYSLIFLLYFFHIVGIFSLAYKISKSTFISVLATILSPWIIGSTSLTARIPSAFINILLPVIIYIILDVSQKSEIMDSSQAVFLIYYILPMFSIIIIDFILIKNKQIPFVRSLIILFSFLLYFIIIPAIMNIKDERQNIFVFDYIIVVIINFFGLLLHFFNEVFVVMVVLLILILKYIFNTKENISTILSSCLLISFILYFTTLYFNIVKYPDNFMFSRLFFGNLYDNAWFNMNFHEKLNYLRKASSDLLLSIFVMNLILLFMELYAAKNENHVQETPHIFGLLTIFLLFIFFLPEGHTWRIISMLNAFFSIHVSEFLYRISCKIERMSFIFINKFLNNYFLLGRNKSLIRMMAVVIIYIVLSTSLLEYTYLNSPKQRLYISYVQNINPEGYFSLITTYELEAAFWIYENTPKDWVKEYWWLYDYEYNKLVEKRWYRSNDSVLISDPATMYYLSVLTGRDVAMIYRVFIYEWEYPKEALRRIQFIREKIFNCSKTIEEILTAINEIRGNHKFVYIIISARTSKWIRSTSTFIIKPDISVNQEFFSIFFNNTQIFHLLYKIDRKIYIFKVNYLWRERNK